MSDLLPNFFRTVNSRIITTNSGLLRKFLKVSLLVSYRLSKTIRDGKDKEVTIGNFDSDIRMVLNPSRSMGKIIFWTGFHELKELMYLHRFLKPDMVFFDIGANMGEYSLFAAKRLGKGQVFSFEPLPAMQQLLAKNISLNDFGNISVMKYGLSDKKKLLTLHEVKDRHEGLATLYPGDREVGATYSVDLRVLDDEISAYAIERLDFIKIDIEGSELQALNGARRSIEKFKPYVMVEINDSTYQMAGYTAMDILNFFKSLNYVPFTFDKDAKLRVCSELPSFGNVLFKPA